MNKVAIIKAGPNLDEAVLKSINEISSLKDIVKKGETVLLKPNFNTDDPYPASSDLAFLKSIVRLVHQTGAKKIIIGESCTFSLKTRKVMENLKIFDMEKMPEKPFVHIFEEHKWIKKNTPRTGYLKSVYLPEILDRVDRIIYLPCLKTHMFSQFSGSLKLSVGFMKHLGPRLKLHLGFLQEKIAELNSLIKPDLIIMDARKCFINGGPAQGDIAEPNLILSSKNRVLLDVEGIKIIQSYPENSLKGLDPWQITQIKKARELNIDGTTGY